MYKSIGYPQELWRPRFARARNNHMGLDQCSTSKKENKSRTMTGDVYLPKVSYKYPGTWSIHSISEVSNLP